MLLPVVLCRVVLRGVQDIDHLAYHGCQLGEDTQGERDGQPSDGPPSASSSSPSFSSWRLLHTLDGSGNQRWSKGAKRRFLYFFSFVHHYELEVEREGWRGWEEGGRASQEALLRLWRAEDVEAERSHQSPEVRISAIAQSPSSCPPGGRPVVFVNVMNHLMAPFNANPTFPLTVHSSYPMFAGDRAVAEKFGQVAVPYKWTLWSFIPDALYSPLHKDLRAEKAEWRRLQRSTVRTQEGVVDREGGPTREEEKEGLEQSGEVIGFGVLRRREVSR